MFVCREGLVRVCTKPYEEPTARNSHQLNAHLTNYSVNKYEADFQHDDDPSAGDRGSKRSLPAVFEHLAELGHDACALERSMHEVVGRTCEAMAGALRDEEEGLPTSWLWPPQPGPHNGADVMSAAGVKGEWTGPAGGEKALSQCFHVLGFDLMFCEAIDGSGAQQAHLLEVNCNPSLAIDSVFPIVGPHACVPRKFPSVLSLLVVHRPSLTSCLWLQTRHLRAPPGRHAATKQWRSCRTRARGSACAAITIDRTCTLRARLTWWRRARRCLARCRLCAV